MGREIFEGYSTNDLKRGIFRLTGVEEWNYREVPVILGMAGQSDVNPCLPHGIPASASYPLAAPRDVPWVSLTDSRLGGSTHSALKS